MLYHYTSFENCLNIIQSNQLLFGLLKNMNDINELYRPIFYNGIDDQLEEQLKTLINSYQQLSFSSDSKQKGFDIPAMWGHYAEKGNGACIIFDKVKLMELFKSQNFFYNKVIYKKEFSSAIIRNKKVNKATRPFSKREILSIFYKKTIEWAYEQEYRVLVYSPDKEERFKLYLEDSIVAVVLHNAPDIKNEETIFSSSNFEKLSSIFPSSKILQYAMFIDEKVLYNQAAEAIWSSQGLNELNFDF